MTRNRRPKIFHANAAPRPAFWQGLCKVVMTLILIVIGGIGVCYFVPELRQSAALAREIGDLAARIEQEEQLLDRQNRELGLLEKNREYLELVARDRLDLMKEGETIFRIETPGDSR